MIEQGKKYFPAIDGLRALAVLCVIFFHLELAWFQGGFIGVDVFFVISGYLITRNIINQQNVGAFSFRVFYLSRVRRLFPAMLATIIITLVLGVLLFPADALIRMAGSAIASTLSLANIRFWSVSGYFDVDASLKPFLHFWSLSVEEQFYIFWPLVLVLLIRFCSDKTKLLILVSAGTFLSLIAMLFVTQYEPSTTFFWVQYRVYEFGFGALLVCVELYYPKAISQRLTRNSILTLLGVCFILYAATAYDKNTLYPGLLSCLGALLILLAKNSVLSAVLLTNKVMTFTGRISYSLYLVHWPIWVFITHWYFREFTLIQKTMIFAVIFISAYALYFFVEQKFRYAKKAQKGVKQTLFYWGVLLLALAILLSCTLIRKNKGLPSRIENSHRVLPASQIECDFTQGKRRQECSFGDKENVQKKVLLIGDSHSFNLRYGLDLFGRSEGVGFYSIAFAGCPPITGVKLHNQGKLRPDKSCLDFSEKLNDILFSEQYRAVIIAARWMWYYEHGEYFSRNGLPEDFLLDSTTTEISSETSRLVWRRQLFKMISKLNERKIKTVIFSQQPLLSKRIGECDKSPSYLIPMSTHSERCKVKIPLNEIMQRLKFTNEFIASLASDFVMPVKPSDYLCNKEACEIFKNGHVLYADDNHLSKAGSRYLIESIEKELSAFLAD